MKKRWGLQSTMTTTYVAVTAGVVLLTELVIFGMTALSSQAPLSAAQVQRLAQSAAAGLAAKLGPSVTPDGALPSTHIGLPGAPLSPGEAQPDGNGGVNIPQTGDPQCDLAPASLAVVVARDGTVLATSHAACYPVGSQGSDAQAGAPRKMLTFVRWPVPGSGLVPLPGGTVAWAAVPVTVGQPPKPGAPGQGAANGQDATVLAFGLLSTGRLTRRLKRLAMLTLAVADGDFQRRVLVSGHDEVSLLEENFNRMASQLQASLDANRRFVAANARHEERSRIARELHDSISQELFSMSVLAGGLRRALPAGSPVLPQVETMERTAGGAMRETRSLLLALRPAALEEADLAGAIDGVCHAYSERLGIPVRAAVGLAGPGTATLPPAVEHAVLRVTQEAVANAARHAGPTQITVRLQADEQQVQLAVTDDGHGFDVADRRAHASGLGLRTMHDRVTELGGSLTIDSAPGDGTRVRACFPLPAAGTGPADAVPADAVPANAVAADVPAQPGQEAAR